MKVESQAMLDILKRCNRIACGKALLAKTTLIGVKKNYSGFSILLTAKDEI